MGLLKILINFINQTINYSFEEPVNPEKKKQQLTKRLQLAQRRLKLQRHLADFMYDRSPEGIAMHQFLTELIKDLRLQEAMLEFKKYNWNSGLK